MLHKGISLVSYYYILILLLKFEWIHLMNFSVVGIVSLDGLVSPEYSAPHQ